MLTLVRTIRYGKIHYPLKEIMNKMYIKPGNEIGILNRYPTRKEKTYRLEFGWLGFLAYKGLTIREKKFRFPIYFRLTIFYGLAIRNDNDVWDSFKITILSAD